MWIKKSLGFTEKRGVFYNPAIGRRRLYRQSIANPQKGLKMLLFDTDWQAQTVCDATNEMFNDNFKVEPKQ
jgi:hypothetical protein